MRLLSILIAAVHLSSCLPENLAGGKHSDAIKEGTLTVDDVLFDQSAEMLGSLWLLRSGHDFLSDNAQKNLKTLMHKQSELRQDMMEICGIQPTLNDGDKAAIAQIKNNKELGNDEKKLRIKTLLNDRMQETSKAITTCRQSQKEELRPRFSERNSLVAACMIALKPYKDIAGLPTKKARAWQQIKTLTNDEKIALNKKLESRECLNALTAENKSIEF